MEQKYFQSFGVHLNILRQAKLNQGNVIGDTLSLKAMRSKSVNFCIRHSDVYELLTKTD